jgi:hypothetical protein
MKRVNFFGILMLSGAVFGMPIRGDAHELDGQSDTGTTHRTLHNRLETRHDAIHQDLREQHQQLHRRLENSDLRPTQRRRIHNAAHDNLGDAHQAAHRRLLNTHSTAHDRTIRPQARPGRAVGPANGPGRRVGPPVRIPPRRVARIARTR